MGSSQAPTKGGSGAPRFGWVLPAVSVVVASAVLLVLVPVVAVTSEAGIDLAAKQVARDGIWADACHSARIRNDAAGEAVVLRPVRSLAFGVPCALAVSALLVLVLRRMWRAHFDRAAGATVDPNRQVFWRSVVGALVLALAFWLPFSVVASFLLCHAHIVDTMLEWPPPPAGTELDFFWCDALSVESIALLLVWAGILSIATRWLVLRFHRARQAAEPAEPAGGAER